ncbi:CopD family protein [Nocardioides currus]|uniref:Copper resistance protein CopC n=1 Tax=Nocardioides currus TaxID=2133958 RepID=A0A2R7Z2B6_9ACTN|nr:CopD family protein [Nocardioides currus]PUA82758.1 copper resistance protein CopC [Nocardioides currus]
MTVARPRTLPLLLAVLAAAWVLALAAPASAHATLISTDPAQGAVLESAPERLLFTFDEGVRGVPDGVQVFDSQGGPVDVAASVSGAELRVELDEPLGEGTTVVVWRVVSEDGHPISGSLTFSVGAPTTDFTPPPAEETDTPDVPWSLTLARWVGYVGLLLAGGLVAFLMLFLPAGRDADVRRRPLRVVRVAAVAAAVAWLVALPLSAMYLLDAGAGSLARGSTWGSLPTSEYAVPVAVVAGLTLALTLLGRGETVGGRRSVALLAAAVAVAAPALTGHTRAASPELLVVATDVLHLVAGAVWLGGLVGLALVLPGLSSMGGRGASAAEVLARFSTAAAGVLAALVAAGSVLAWRILGSWSGLVDTTYGRLLLVKIGIVLVAVAIAAWNRWSLLPRLQRAGGRDEAAAVTRPVARATAVEAVVLVAVLAVTGVLVDRSPEGEPKPASAAATADSDPGTRSTTLGEIEVEASLTPLTRGPTTLTLRLRDAAGAPTEGVAPPVVRLASDRVVLGNVPLQPVSAGLYTAEVVLPSAGTWRMQVSLRVSEFANPVGELEFDVS